MWETAEASFGGAGSVATDSSSGGGQKTKGHRCQTIMPATIKQLLECSDNMLKVEGFEANVITILGVVRKVETSTIKTSMFIDDQTGTIECIHYHGTEGDNNSDLATMTQGMYGRIVGALHSMGSHPNYLVSFKASPITDLNELTMHLLEVISNRKKLMELRLAEERKNAGEGINLVVNIKNSMSAESVGGPTGTWGCENSGVGLMGLTENQNIVHEVISSFRDQGGIHRNEIIKQIKNRISQTEITKILEFLSNEGYVYFTVDDDHYAATDAQLM